MLIFCMMNLHMISIFMPFQVYTVNMSQLPVHIPKDSLPQQLGGNLEWCQKQWLSQCLHETLGKNNDTAIRAYFENADKIIMDGVANRVALTPASNGSVPSAGDMTPVTSDPDSEESKETIQEKYNDEEREKEVAVEKDDSNKQLLNTVIPVTVSSINNKDDLTKDHPTPPCKRGNDSSPTQGSDGEAKIMPSMPCKRRPTSYDNVQSIHQGEPGGCTADELVECVQIKKQKGLYREYALIKQEPPAGTFDISR